MFNPYVVLFWRRLLFPLGARSRDINRLAWAAAAVFVCVVLAPQKRRSYPHDLYQFWVTGQALKTMPVHDIYSPQDQQTVTQEFKERAADIRSPGLRATTMRVNKINYTATPLLLVVMNLFYSGDFEVDLARFRVVSALLFGFGFIALAASLGFPGIGALILLIAFSKFSWPYQMNTIVVNVSGAQAGAFMLILSMLRGATPVRLGLFGFLLGFLNLLKPTLAPAALLLLIHFSAQRRWLEVAWYAAGLALAAVVGLAVPWFIFGSACTWWSWRAAMPVACFTPWGLNGGFLTKLTGLKDPAFLGVFSAILTLAAMAVVALSGGRFDASRRQRWVQDAGAAALGALLSLLASPIVRSHYFLAAVPAALIALRPAGMLLSISATRRTLCYLAVFLLVAHPLFRFLGLTRWPNHGLWTFAGVWILAAVLIRDRFAAASQVGLTDDGRQGRP